MVEWPSRLALDLTWKCNLRCSMCTMHMNDRPGQGMSEKYADMSDEIFANVEPLVPHLSWITVGGCGEPFLAKNVLVRLTRIRELSPHATIIVFTNGTRLADRGFAEEASALVNWIHLSLDGVSSYEQIHIGSSFRIVLAALENLRDVRAARDGQPALAIEFILMRRNCADIVAAAQLAKEFSASKIIFKDMWVHGPVHVHESPRHDPHLAAQIREEILKARQVGIPITCAARPELSWPHSPGAPREPRIPCDDPWKQVHVLVDGRVFLCCRGQTCIGHLGQDSFEQIWNGDEVNRYREGILSHCYYKDCAACPRTAPGESASYERYARDAPGNANAAVPATLRTPKNMESEA